MWIALSLIAAFLWSSREGVLKRAMQDVGPVVLTLGIAGLTALLLLPLALLRGEAIQASAFWLALGVSAGINSLCTVLIARAVFHSDLSLVAPLQSLTPVFMLLWAPWLLRETPSVLGIVGVVVVVAGTYLLGLPSRREQLAGQGGRARLLMPFQALWEDEGARMMLAVALLFSVSATVDKVGVVSSGPLLWGGALHAAMLPFLVPFALLRLGTGRMSPRQPLSTPGAAGGSLSGMAPRTAPAAEGRGAARALGWMVLAGALNAVMMAAQMFAYTLALAAYVIAVKRSSVLFSVLLGGVLFRESKAGTRVWGTAWMLVGFLLLTLAG